ncbi:MAG: hypothetical protein U0271_41800 [Polyangiaceae bacterium]
MRPTSLLLLSSAIVLFFEPRLARAAESAPDAEPDKAEAPESRERPAQHVRFNTGIGVYQVGTMGVGVPIVGSVGVEVHAVGPLWFVGQANGYYSVTSNAAGTTTTSRSEEYGGGGRLGFIVEVPLLEKLEAGGFAELTGNRSFADYGANFDPMEATTIGGVAGISAHYRPNPVFGLRFALTLLAASKTWQTLGDLSTEFGIASLVAWPSVEMTFTL